jgi:predicted MFS family arabinose efflux permease
VPPERQSQTIGIVSGAGSLGTLAVAPLGEMLITDYGWQTALVAFAGIGLLMALTSIAIGGRSERSASSAASDVEFSTRKALLSALGHRGYMAMAIAFFACGFQLMFITTHLPQFLAGCGLPPTVAASALGLIGLGNAVGCYVVGYLGAYFSQKRLLALIYLLRTCATLIFLTSPITTASTLIFASVMGLFWLSVAPPISALIGRIFGLQHFNMLFGLTFFSHQLGAFAGSWLGGVTFDVTGSYAIAWGTMIALGVFAFALQWFMDDSTEAGHSRSEAAVHPHVLE